MEINLARILYTLLGVTYIPKKYDYNINDNF